MIPAAAHALGELRHALHRAHDVPEESVKRAHGLEPLLAVDAQPVQDRGQELGNRSLLVRP